MILRKSTFLCKENGYELDHKRTVLVGLAFLSICAFWQMYDSVVPLILTKTST